MSVNLRSGPKNLLITAGPTREPIDEVRFLSNISSGATGVKLALRAVAAGYSVTLALGTGATVTPPQSSSRLRLIRFGSTENLAQILAHELSAPVTATPYDIIIHAAAISDYRPICTHTGKLSSDVVSPPALELTPTPKLLPLLRSWSSTPIQVIGFKFTSSEHDAIAQVNRLFERGGVDLVVHNSLQEYQRGERAFQLYGPGPTLLRTLSSVDTLADELLCPSRTNEALCVYS